MGEGGGGEGEEVFAGEVVEFGLELAGGDGEAGEGGAVAEGVGREGGGGGGGELAEEGVAEEEVLFGGHGVEWDECFSA